VDEGTSSQAVERFDQLGGGMSPTDEQTTEEGGLPDKEGTATASLGGVLMDQWLERIEGDPAFLLRNQFMLEEKRALEQTGRELIETRPW
jgi:Ca-activated chloride channel family protein